MLSGGKPEKCRRATATEVPDREEEEEEEDSESRTTAQGKIRGFSAGNWDGPQIDVQLMFTY